MSRLTTDQLRSAWAPACYNRDTVVSLNGSGKVRVDTRIVSAVIALNACLVRWHYATRYGDTGAFACRKITGGTGWSLHALKIALDLNWQTNPYGAYLVTDEPAGMRADIKAIRTTNGEQVWGWGGDYSGHKDAMHWEVIQSPSTIATGIGGLHPPPPKVFVLPGFTQTLHAGMRLTPNEHLIVTRLQDLLRWQSMVHHAPSQNPGASDGDFGPRTKAAWVAFKVGVDANLRLRGKRPFFFTHDDSLGPKGLEELSVWATGRSL